jgi:hypothetical protein
VPVSFPRPQSAFRGQFPLDEGKRGAVLTTIVRSLQQSLAASGGRNLRGVEESGRLARLADPEREGSPVDIHIRLGATQLEVEVAEGGEGPGHGSSDSQLEFRTWLLQRLRAEGLSQESAARRIGVSTRTVGRWARGQTQPRMRDLGRVREALGDLPAF